MLERLAKDPFFESFDVDGDVGEFGHVGLRARILPSRDGHGAIPGDIAAPDVNSGRDLPE